ncbi:MAG: DUF4846 domain-containing protein [Minicystis sp.]
MRARRALGAAVATFLLIGCTRGPIEDTGLRSSPPQPPPAASPPPVAVTARPSAPAPTAAPASPSSSASTTPPPSAAYPWLADPASSLLPPADALVDRFTPPAGFTRVAAPPGTFGAWLRRLPLAPPGTSVVSYRGDLILPADHANLAAVVALDVGARDLQQCADSIIRLHAEWLYAQGRRDMSYRAASGAPMPFARWAQGERAVPDGQGFRWVPSSRSDASHGSFRRWLDAVFSWANTGSLARDAEVVASDELRPGDFVVQAGAPGHAVLVLDLARAPDGRRALLLGQGFMPAQSFHVLRPGGREGPWFVVEPGDAALATPFWAPFPWKALRRFPGA